MAFFNFGKKKKKSFLMSGGGGLFGGSGEFSALDAYKNNPRVRMALQPIVNYISSNLWYIEKKNEIGEWREDLQHPFIRMLERGNRTMSGQACMRLLVQYITLEGGCHIYIERGEKTGLPYYYTPLRDSFIRQNDKGYTVQVGNRTFFADERDMFHIIDVDPSNPFSGKGLSMFSALKDEISIDERAANIQANDLAENRIPPLMITLDGEFEEEDIEKMKQRIYDAGREGGLFLTNVAHEVTPLASKMVDMPLLDIRRDVRDIILETINIPKEIVGIIENSNRSTIEAAEYHLIQNVIIPKLEFIRTEFQEKHIVHEYGHGTVLRYVSPSKDNKEFTLKAMASAPNSFTKDEVRDLVGYSALVAGGDEKIYDDSIISQPALSSSLGAISDDGEDSAASDVKSLKKKINKSYLTYSQIVQLLESVPVDQILKAKDPMKLIRNLIVESGQYSINELASPLSGINYNTTSAGYLKALADTELRIVTIHKATTRNEISEFIIKGMESGLNIKETAKQLQEEYFGDKVKRGKYGVDYRAMRIAETEAGRAANFGRNDGYKQTGLARWKQWLHNSRPNARANRTIREHHWVLDKVAIPFDDRFEVVDENGVTDSALHPHDFALRENNINCRCSFVVTLEKPSDAKSHLQKAQMHVDGFEKLKEKHLAKIAKNQSEIFRAIVDDVTEKLRGLDLED